MRHFLLACLFIFSVQLAMGQITGNQKVSNITEEEYLLFEQTQPAPLNVNENNAQILQFGEDQQARVQISAEAYEASILQFGLNNQVDLSMEGNNIQVTNLQLGENNQLSQSIEGNNLNIQVTQFGNGNHLEHNEQRSGSNAANPIEYSITQTGGMTATITFN